MARAMVTPQGKKARRRAARQEASEITHWRAVCGLDSPERSRNDVTGVVRRHAPKFRR